MVSSRPSYARFSGSVAGISLPVPIRLLMMSRAAAYFNPVSSMDDCIPSPASPGPFPPHLLSCPGMTG